MAPTWSFRVSFLFRSPLIGTFASCEGLGYEIEHEEYQEGGNNDYTWRFPTRVRYSNLTLKRPVTSADSFFLDLWMLQQMISPTQGKELALALVGERCFISCFNQRGKKILTWVLTDAVPVRLSSPSFSVADSSIAEETIEIAHSGITALPI
ncbi:phage tail protein [Streptomyces sp. H27-H5]|nr:phage tail protein [Streptomyces sp. H27-H5]MCY0924102.1 phage tail protein [Streptomyces sp. H27-G5]MCY0962358.1 phage tail protein [Streptomyces sp. H27-H5]